MSQRYFALITIIVVGLLFNSEVFAQSGYVAPKRIVTLKITQVTPADQPWCDDWDFYIKSSIGGQQMPTLEVPFSFEGTHCGAFAYSAENFDNLFVSWQEMLACDLSPIEITIQLFERDGAFDGDDAEARTTFTVDPQAETPIADCYDQGSDGGFCYEVTIVGSTLSDQDGDGLPDEWELYGFDANCDGEITSGEDLLLPQMGANPNHKDLFIEVNWFEGYAPTAATLQAVKDAFGRAPVTAGGVRNPDDQEGITIHFDAGPVMNDVGFYGQGGRTLGPASQSPRSVADLHALMDQVEDVKRRGIFRQVVYGPIMEDGYPLPWAGQFVGNDRIQVENDSASTLMHELGHALGLLHGGELAATDPWRVHGHNCKPNHISVMSYMYPTILFENAGRLDKFIDFSPSKIPDDMLDPTELAKCPSGTFGCNRRLPLLGLPVPPMTDPTHTLTEGLLDETRPILKSDISAGLIVRHVLLYYDENGVPRPAHLADPVDWNGDGEYSPQPVAANIDLDPNDDRSFGCGPGVNGELEILENLDEWSRIVLPPGRGVLGQLANPDEYYVDLHPPPTEERIDELLRSISRTDLAVTAALEPTPVYVGSPLELRVEVSNLGRNSAYDGNLEVTLPAGVSAITVPDQCTQLAYATFRCSTMVDDRALRAQQTITFRFDLEVEANSTGHARQVLLRAQHDGEDPNPSNNGAAVPVYVFPKFFGFDDATRPWVPAWNSSGMVETTTSRATSGAHAAILDCGHLQFESPTWNTSEVEMVGESLVVDVWIPEEQDLYWPGSLDAHLDIPSAGLWQVALGHVEFASLPRATWVSVSFPVSLELQQILLGDFPDARIRFGATVASCGHPILLDSVRFEGDVRARDVYHQVGGAPVSVVSSSVLSFEEIEDWSSEDTTVSLVSDNVMEGSHALAVGAASWARVVSRPFETSELSSIGDRFSIDVFIPELPADYFWFGTMGIFLDCPSAGLMGAYIGHQPLHVLFDGEYNRLEFELPEHVVNALQGNYDGCRFFLDFAMDSSLGSIVLDRGGFIQ